MSVFRFFFIYICWCFNKYLGIQQREEGFKAVKVREANRLAYLLFNYNIYTYINNIFFLSCNVNLWYIIADR